MADYKDTISQTIIQLLEAELGTEFKAYREGDPIIFPASMMPALFVSEPVTENDIGATGFDTIIHQILIQLVFNKKSEFGAPTGVATLDNVIDHMVQGRDPETGVYLPNSVMGILRRNLTLNNMVIDQKCRIEKYTLPRSETLWTTEAQVRITITEEQQIPDRL